MTETFTPENLIAGGFPRVMESVTLLSGESRKRGTLLGKVTASEKLKLCNSANTDGSQTPYGILAEDCDASSADKVTSCFLSGEFNSNAMTFGGTDTAATHKAALRDLNIYLKTNVSA